MRISASLTRVIGLANVAVVTTAVIGLGLMPSDGAPHVRPDLTGNAGASLEGVTKPTQAPQDAGQPPGVVATPEFARQIHANELGLVPILMYHRIVPKRLASIDRTPDQLRKELEKLARQGYVPITAREFATGQIQVPAGKSPVVLTFDDGHPSHFGLDSAGNPKPDTAVSIIMDVSRRYPGFRPVATFWVNRAPFGLEDTASQKAAVSWLTGHGFEVANHTWAHPDLRALPKKKVREQITRLERLLVKLGVGPSKTLALPYGSMPRARKIAIKGNWDGTRYDFAGVFLAGAEPSLSPYAKKFDRLAIQRIQSNGKKGECRKWCSQYWLEWLNKHPGERYVSDGDPERISIPRRLRGNIDLKRRPQVNAY
ncbi:polysaccharide deacetylase family protein [Nonomuraea pusilla]|uniref:Peptidoglycan/xylan/chitin deacetylase, PgdA/CDA1 family n=1 Tax=Nonomuraea pusilla TaxID=46177 RepID=A0A1H7NYN7_9ACTN|nr:polysaccharide deacetylase family protein [Nonomuraea pusilla]SEL28720.1 Peptidoglycan/xylan/chitin deacetylase, PgdA/CDA1 family [Nonomuraea pusilla]